MAQREDNQAAFNRAKSILDAVDNDDVPDPDDAVRLAEWVVALDEDAIKSLLAYRPEK